MCVSYHNHLSSPHAHGSFFSTTPHHRYEPFPPLTPGRPDNEFPLRSTLEPPARAQTRCLCRRRALPATGSTRYRRRRSGSLIAPPTPTPTPTPIPTQAWRRLLLCATARTDARADACRFCAPGVPNTIAVAARRKYQCQYQCQY